MVILFSERKAEILLLEVNKETSILDTCCAGSTAGEEWIEANIDNRSQEDRSDIKRKEGRSHFRFGNGKTFKSKQFLLMQGIFATFVR